MAGLFDTISKNKKLVRGPNGELTEQTQEETQNLASKAGLASPPTTPLGVGAIGGNPDQQKMAGTPAQKTAALNLAGQSEVGNNLQDALRRKQVRTEATTEEQGQASKSQNLKDLGGLGDRVNDFMNAQRSQLETASNQGLKADTAEYITDRNGNQLHLPDLGSIKNLLTEFRDNPDNQDNVVKLNQALGYDITKQLTPEQVDSLYRTAVDTITQGAAGNVDNDLNVDDLVNNPKFGYDKNQLAQLLGVSPDEIGKYSVGQLRDQLNKVADDEFSKTKQLEQQANSGLLGQAERGLARENAQESSMVGQRASEADVSNLEQQIANADEVTFGGKIMKVDELLKDENISSIITDYMNSAPGSDIRNQIDQNEPALKDFIQKNQAVLADASQKMQGSAKTFQETQEFNKKLQYEPFGGVKLDDNLAKLFIPGFGELQASKVDPAQVPILKLAQEKGPQYGQSMANNINTEYKNDPQTANDLNGLDFETLKTWDVGGGSDSPWNTSYVQPKRFWEAVSKLPPEQQDDLMRKVSGDVFSKDEAQQRMNTNRISNVLGNDSSLNSTLLDANGDGIVDSFNTIKSALLKANPRPELKNGPSSQTIYKPVDLGKPSIPSSGSERTLFNKLAPAAVTGYVDGRALMDAKLDLDELITLQNKSDSKVNMDVVNALQREARTSNTNAKVTEAGNDINKLNELLKQDSKHVDANIVNAKLAELNAMPSIIQSAIDRGNTAESTARSVVNSLSRF